MKELIAKGAQLVENADHILVFTGAGLSTESGIPDFRSAGGVWEKYDPSDFYYQKFVADEKAREKYWTMSTEFYATMRGALPNPAHLAIKTLEDRGKLLSVVTQNIDNLHHKAGNSPEKIIELHGTAFSVYCLDCGKTYDRDQIQARIAAGEKAPRCDDCSGPLKPATISFGQAMPEEKMVLAMMHTRECDLCIVLGSSLVVYPAASVPMQAHQNGAKLIIINRDETPLDPLADLLIHNSVAQVLPQIVG